VAKVDVAIMRVPGEREDWFQYCLESLEREPVNVHIIEGVVGHIGKGRIKCLQVGSEPYVAYVDPDDLVCRGAFQACIDALEAQPDKVLAYTREAWLHESGLMYAAHGRNHYEPFFGTEDEAFRAHHLCVYRRSALPDLGFLADYPNMPEQALKQRLWDNNFAFIDQVGYGWRKHDNQSHCILDGGDWAKAVHYRYAAMSRKAYVKCND